MTTAIPELLADLARRGVTFRLDGDQVLMKPARLVEDDERAELVAGRDEVRSLLKADAEVAIEEPPEPEPPPRPTAPLEVWAEERLGRGPWRPIGTGKDSYQELLRSWSPVARRDRQPDRVANIGEAAEGNRFVRASEAGTKRF